MSVCSIEPEGLNSQLGCLIHRFGEFLAWFSLPCRSWNSSIQTYCWKMEMVQSVSGGMYNRRQIMQNSSALNWIVLKREASAWLVTAVQQNEPLCVVLLDSTWSFISIYWKLYSSASSHQNLPYLALLEFNFGWFLSHLYLWSFSSPQGRTNLVTSLFQSPVPMKRDHPAALCWGQRIDWSQCAFCHLHNVFFNCSDENF